MNVLANLSIGQAFRILRIKQGLSMKQLAEKSHLTRQTIYNIENDYYDKPTTSMYLLAYVLGTTIEDMENEIKGI